MGERVGGINFFLIPCARLRVPKRKILNFTVADMLMVVYLTVIGYHDKMYEGEYFAHAHEWESSYLCTLIGVTAVISSEVRTVS